MSEAAIIDLILKGGAIAVLVIVGVLILRGTLVTKGSHDAVVEATRAGAAAVIVEIQKANTALVAELTRDRDDWKAIAKDAVGDVRELSEALTVRNRIDEGLRKSGVLREVGAT